MQTKDNKFSIDSLPKRAKQSDAVKNFEKDSIVTNYYSLDLSKNYTIYQYDITFQPQLPEDSRGVIKGCVGSVEKELLNKLNFFIHRGKIIYALVKLDGLQTFKCNYIHKKGTKQQKKYDYLLNLNKTKQFNLKALDYGTKQSQKVLQVLNSDLKQRLHKASFIQLGNTGKFYKSDTLKIQNSPFKIYRGFTTSIHLINNKLELLVDVSTRVIRNQNLLQTIKNMKYDDEKDDLIGRSVLAIYGNWKLYKIKKINTNTKITNTFEKNGQKITYLKYFEEKYGVKIMDKNQQLILSSNKRKTINKEGKLVTEENDVYLVPQLVSLTGMSEAQKNDFKLMQAVANYTKITPKQRLQQSRQLIKKLKDSEIYKLSQYQTKVDGFILEQPKLIYGNNEVVKPNNGSVNTRAKVLRPMNLKSWVLVYSQMGQRDRDGCDDFVSTLKKCSGAYGIKIPEPDYVVVESSKSHQFINKIEDSVAKHGKPQIIVTLLKPNQKRFYPQLKKLMLNKVGVPHQAVVTKSVDNQKRKMSVCSKIVLQMNAKVGEPIWKIEQRLPNLKNRKILMGGMAIYHKLINKTNSCCAFAGSVNDQQTEYYLGAKLTPQNQQQFDSLYGMIQQWVKTYCKETKTTPDTLIVYRDGVGESQIQTILSVEVQVIKKAIQTIKQKMKKPDYNPGIVFILANKKINQRIYQSKRSQSRDRAKGQDNIGNPRSGTVVGKGISRYGFDFHMSPHNVTQGSCTPTQFNVIYNTSNLTEDQLMTLTFESCFGYFNWSGAVRVPAALQYANKLSTLIGDSMKCEPNDIALKKKLYCL